MFKNPLYVYRVYFEPDHRPHAAAEFELVALQFPDATAARLALGRGERVRGRRLICWPTPNDPGVRAVDLICSITLTKDMVRSVRPCSLTCVFRSSVDDALAGEGAA